MVYFLLAAAAVTTQTFAISTLFSKASNAAMAAGFFTYLGILPFQYGVSQQATTGEPFPPPPAQQAFCLLPASCIGLGMFTLSMSDAQGENVAWSNIHRAPTPTVLSMADVLVMLIFDIVWTFSLAVYIELVFPGETGGVPLSPYFPLQQLIRLFAISAGYTELACDPDLELDHKPDPNRVQPHTNSGAPVGLVTAGLSKVFAGRSGNKPTVAVNNLSLSLKKGEITALLGENGAGKTTTMSMLCGLFGSTAGTIKVDGRDAASNQDYLHDNVGVCPQHDVLWDRLSVAEHLELFAWLKVILEHAPVERLRSAR